MKKKKDRSRLWWWLSLFMVAAAAIITGYFLGMERGHREQERLARTQAIVTKKKEASQIEKEPPQEKESIVVGEIIKPESLMQDDSCQRVEQGIRDFFQYLDKKNYIRHLEEGLDTERRFIRLVKILSATPPIPAGEGIDVSIMTKNIYHFYRLLDKNDIRLLREVMSNEAETMELNLDLFFKWIMMEDRCPDPEGIRPPLEVSYLYAGFFLNTIGGRAYLFRRPAALRILLNYYCVLVIHEADKKGKNSYGIDVFSHIAPLANEISNYKAFQFQNDYLLRLNEMSKYYLQKRE